MSNAVVDTPVNPGQRPPAAAGQTRGPVDEANTPALRGPLTCLRCGHVTPYVEGWMVSAAMHHISAVHSRDAARLARH